MGVTAAHIPGSDEDTTDSIGIRGGTDATIIGNSGDKLKVDGSAVTQPISAASLPLPSGASTSGLQTTGNTSVASIDTKTPALGQALAASSVPVVLTAAQITTLTPLSTIAATQSGTWTVQPGNTANTTAWKVDGSAVTQPVSSTTLATAANQSTEITSLQLIDNVIGPVTPGTVATNSTLIGGQYNSTLPTLTTGQQAAAQANANGILYVDPSQAPLAFINRTDVSTTVSASGSSSTFDTNGLLALSANFQVTAISGSGAYIQFHIQASDDGTNWVTYMDTARITATGFARYQGLRQSGRYYRYSWDVAGSTPSITFNIVTTIKSVQTDRKSRRFFYSDIDLSTLGAASSVFSADDCRNVTCTFQRGADGGSNGTVQLFASMDSVIWYSVSGNLAANVSANNDVTLSNQSWPFYQLQVTAKTNAGTRVLDIQWNAN